MRQTFKPRPYQSIGMAHLLDLPRCALWAGMGMGKTTTTLNTIDALILAGQSQPTLVVAPLRVAKSTWPTEVRKWQHLAHLEVVPIVGDNKTRMAAVRRDAPIYSINYEQIPWLVEHYGSRWPFATIVADESTRLKGFRLRQGTQRAQQLARVAHSRASRFVELTGTPSPNGLIDLWGQAWFLDRGERLGRTFAAFTRRWFQSIPGSDGHTQLRSLPFAQTQIEDRMRDLCLTLDPHDWFDLQEPIHTVVRVDLPVKVRKTYDQFERELFMSLGAHEVEAFNAAAKTMKGLQLANGAVYVGDHGEEWVEVHEAKIEALESVIGEAAGAPVLVAYQFQSDLTRLLRAFPQGRHLDADPQTEAEWNAGKIPVLFAHPKSAGHGLNLQDGGNVIAFFGHWWDLELRQQIIERIGPVRQQQAGHDRPVWVYDIVASDTIDEVVLARHESKRGVQDLLLEAMKRRH